LKISRKLVVRELVDMCVTISGKTRLRETSTHMGRKTWNLTVQIFPETR